MRCLLGASLMALLTGCPSDGADGVYVTAAWSFRSVYANTPVDCPAGVSLAALHTLAVDGSPCDPRGGEAECVTDLACEAGAGTSRRLVPNNYDVWLDFRREDGSYARTTSEQLDLTLGDKPYARQVLTDGGVFRLAWSLVDASGGGAETCESAGVAGIVINASDEADPSAATGDEVNCEDLVGTSFGLPAATYTVSIEAVNIDGQTLGLADSLSGQVITAPSGVTELGTITIPVSVP